MKRAIDIFGAILGLIFLLLLIPLTALAIFLEDGPLFIIKQRRISRGKVVMVYKFRSMVKGAEKMKAGLMNKNERSDGPFFKIKNDPRITKVGKILRRTRLDEFPQFFNVLKGDLSLVGPRPHEPEELLAYPPEFWKIYPAKSGLTGLSQISGNHNLPFQQELELDKRYLENQSILLDLKIIAKTIWILISSPNGV